MLIPAPPAPPAPELASAELSSTAFAITGALGDRPVPTRLAVRARMLNVLAGHSVLISGRLQTGSAGLPGRIITLQARARRGWHEIAHTHTATNGRYRLRFLARRTGSEAL